MIYEMTVPQFTKMLKNLDVLLEKAAGYADSKKFDVGVLLNARLAPDQFHFIRQVQIACGSAETCVSKITGKAAPSRDDKESTVAQLRQRISDTIAFMGSVSEKDFSGAKEIKVTTPRWEGKYLLGHEYVVQHSIPNFYFHVTVAYEILRHNGLEIGKNDFLGQRPFKS